MIGPTDLLHPSPTPHFKTYDIYKLLLFVLYVHKLVIILGHCTTPELGRRHYTNLLTCTQFWNVCPDDGQNK
jgi:hypothetical protein